MANHGQIATRLCKKSDSDAMTRGLTGHSMEYKPARPDNDKPATIIGYGWAVYAVRIDDTVIIDDRWHGYSTSTSGHLTEIARSARRSNHVNLVYFNDSRKHYKSRPGYPDSFSTNFKRTCPTIEQVLQETGFDRDELQHLGPVKARPLSHMPDMPNGWDGGAGTRSSPNRYTHWYYGPEHELEVYSDGADTDYKHKAVMRNEDTQKIVYSATCDSMQEAYMAGLGMTQEVIE